MTFFFNHLSNSFFEPLKHFKIVEKKMKRLLRLNVGEGFGNNQTSTSFDEIFNSLNPKNKLFSEKI